MTASATLDIQRAMDIIADGRAQSLEGRGVNASYRVADGGQEFSVKVHCINQSSHLHRRRLQRVDEVLRKMPWYPQIVGTGLHGTGRSRLVVIRPFARGAVSDCAPDAVAALVDVLGELAAVAQGVAVAEDLVCDYVAPWLSSRDQERQMLERVVTKRFALVGQAVDERVDDLLAGALRLTRPDDVVVYHGDLHCRNLILGGRGEFTVIDWDEAGFSNRPADVAKALWLACRNERGDFVLNPRALSSFLNRANARLRLPYGSAVDVAKLGAIWFLPRYDHITLLERRQRGLARWYLGWVCRFWSRFAQNLDLIAVEAARLERETS